MKTPTAESYETYRSLFNRYFRLSERLPAFVFKKRDGYKVVIRESGELHGVETFARLGKEFGDHELNYLMIEPNAATIFQSAGKFAAYTLSFGDDFERQWTNELRGFGQSSRELHNTWPWMYASIQSYFGSSGLWCSYHDNYTFELDMFYVPVNCDSAQLFGVEAWSFDTLKSESISHRLNYSELELQQFKDNYFYK